jgi:hypothetical protein
MKKHSNKVKKVLLFLSFISLPLLVFSYQFSFEKIEALKNAANDSTPGEALFLSGCYRNIYSSLKVNGTNDVLQDPLHCMSEHAYVNSSYITYGGPSQIMGAGSVTYETNFRYIPSRRLTDAVSKKYVDYEWRGMIILFGEEYYVKDIDGISNLYAYKGGLLKAGNTGYSEEYKGYRFKTDGIHYVCNDETCTPDGVSLNVLKPDHSNISVNLTSIANNVVGGLELSLMNASFNVSSLQTYFMAYDLSTEAKMADGAHPIVEGIEDTDWSVHLVSSEQPFTSEMNITEYYNISLREQLLEKIVVTYTGTKRLGFGGNLTLPGGYKVIYTGAEFRIMSINACNIYGDYYPCDSISLAEVVEMINRWATGNAKLVEVVNLINRWATGYST